MKAKLVSIGAAICAIAAAALAGSYGPNTSTHAVSGAAPNGRDAIALAGSCHEMELVAGGSILVYDHDTQHSLAWEAAVNLAGAGAVMAGSADFSAELVAGDWDVVAVDCPNVMPADGWVALEKYVYAGGHVVMSYWDWDGSSAPQNLLDAFGAAATTADVDWGAVDKCLTDMATSPIFMGVAMPNCDWHDHWIDDGDHFKLLEGSEGLAQSDGTGPPVIFAGNDNRTIAASVIDEAGDKWLESGSGVTLWENMLKYVVVTEPSCEIVYDGSPGTGPPPGTLGPFTMTPFPDDPRPVYDDVVAVPAPGGGTIDFSIPLSHREIGSGWASWSHGYTGDVYFTGGPSEVTVYMPGNTVAFYLYVEPNAFAEFEFEVVADTGTTSGKVMIQGSAGAKYFGFYMKDRGVIRYLKITNTDGAAGGFAIGEFGIARGEIKYDGSPGTGAPPATLGPYTMQPFPPDPRPVYTDVMDVEGPCGVVEFDIPLSHRRIGEGWATWSHGYMGDVYFTNSESKVTLFMPPETAAFYLYVEPNTFAEFEFVVQSNTGASSGIVFIHGSAGAKYFGFYAPGAGEILWISVENIDGAANGFAIGEFACAPIDCGGEPCPADINGDGVVDVLDLLEVLSGWGGSGPADVNGDGVVDVLDLLEVLAAWGPCP